MGVCSIKRGGGVWLGIYHGLNFKLFEKIQEKILLQYIYLVLKNEKAFPTHAINIDTHINLYTVDYK